MWLATTSTPQNDQFHASRRQDKIAISKTANGVLINVKLLFLDLLLVDLHASAEIVGYGNLVECYVIV